MLKLVTVCVAVLLLVDGGRARELPRAASTNPEAVAAESDADWADMDAQDTQKRFVIAEPPRYETEQRWRPPSWSPQPDPRPNLPWHTSHRTPTQKRPQPPQRTHHSLRLHAHRSTYPFESEVRGEGYHTRIRFDPFGTGVPLKDQHAPRSQTFGNWSPRPPPPVLKPIGQLPLSDRPPPPHFVAAAHQPHRQPASFTASRFAHQRPDSQAWDADVSGYPHSQASGQPYLSSAELPPAPPPSGAVFARPFLHPGNLAALVESSTVDDGPSLVNLDNGAPPESLDNDHRAESLDNGPLVASLDEHATAGLDAGHLDARLDNGHPHTSLSGGNSDANLDHGSLAASVDDGFSHTSLDDRPPHTILDEIPLPTSVGERPLPTSEGERPLPTSEGERPLPTSEGERPLPTSEGERPLPTSEGERPLPTSEGERPLPTHDTQVPDSADAPQHPEGRSHSQAKVSKERIPSRFEYDYPSVRNVTDEDHNETVTPDTGSPSTEREQRTTEEPQSESLAIETRGKTFSASLLPPSSSAPPPTLIDVQSPSLQGDDVTSSPDTQDDDVVDSSSGDYPNEYYDKLYDEFLDMYYDYDGEATAPPPAPPEGEATSQPSQTISDTASETPITTPDSTTTTSSTSPSPPTTPSTPPPNTASTTTLPTSTSTAPATTTPTTTLPASTPTAPATTTPTTTLPASTPTAPVTTTTTSTTTLPASTPTTPVTTTTTTTLPASTPTAPVTTTSTTTLPASTPIAAAATTTSTTTTPLNTTPSPTTTTTSTTTPVPSTTTSSPSTPITVKISTVPNKLSWRPSVVRPAAGAEEGSEEQVKSPGESQRVSKQVTHLPLLKHMPTSSTQTEVESVGPPISLSEIMQGLGMTLPQFLVALKAHGLSMKEFTTSLQASGLTQREFKKTKNDMESLLSLLKTGSSAAATEGAEGNSTSGLESAGEAEKIQEKRVSIVPYWLTTRPNWRPSTTTKRPPTTTSTTTTTTATTTITTTTTTTTTQAPTPAPIPKIFGFRPGGAQQFPARQHETVLNDTREPYNGSGESKEKGPIPIKLDMSAIMKEKGLSASDILHDLGSLFTMADHDVTPSVGHTTENKEAEGFQTTVQDTLNKEPGDTETMVQETQTTNGNVNNKESGWTTVSSVTLRPYYPSGGYERNRPRPYRPLGEGGGWNGGSHRSIITNRHQTTQRPTLRPPYRPPPIKASGEIPVLSILYNSTTSSNGNDISFDFAEGGVPVGTQEGNDNQARYPHSGYYPVYDNDPDSLNMSTKSAIMAASILGGVAMCVFLAIFVVVMYKGHGRLRRLPRTLSSDASSSSTPPIYSTRISGGKGAHKTSGFWGTLKKRFDPYSLSPTPTVMS